jgi:hypothetical protein
MADINLINYTPITVTHSYTGTNDGAGVNSIDDNFSTYQGVDSGSVRDNVNNTCISQHIFPRAFQINSIRYRLYSHAEQTYAGNTSYIVRIEYTTNGTDWSTVSGTEVTGGSSGGDGGSTHTYDTGDTTKIISIANCLGIRAYVYSLGHSAEGWVLARSRVYEVRAYGQPYNDVGLRFYSGSVKKIGVEPTLASKLRFYKDGTTYGIPLVATTDTMASPIRITLSGELVKALPTVD